MSSDERSSTTIGPSPPEESGPSAVRDLRGLFVEVTGTDRIVERQEVTVDSRCLDRETDDSELSEYVARMAQEDGLGETLSEPDTGSPD